MVRCKDGFTAHGNPDAFYSGGSYFARKASYSHHYAYRSDDVAGAAANPQGPFHHLILAQVLCGRSKREQEPWPQEQRRRPGYWKAVLGDQFDSVLGGPHLPRPGAPAADRSEMYVVYTSSQTLPEYVVSYQVRGPGAGGMPALALAG